MRNDHNNGYSDGCIATMSSMTHAMRAQKALAGAAIRSEVIKLDSSLTKKGCSYGLSFQCAHLSNVRAVLSNARISVRQYINGDSGHDIS